MKIPAKVRGLGKAYADGLEVLEIHVRKQDGNALPFRFGTRIPISLEIDGTQYRAGLRSTRNCNVIWICPDVQDDSGKRLKLAHIFQRIKLSKNDPVEIEPLSAPNSFSLRAP